MIGISVTILRIFDNFDINLVKRIFSKIFGKILEISGFGDFFGIICKIMVREAIYPANSTIIKEVAPNIGYT